MDADLLVVGAGGAGLCASIAAAERGADVVLIEKNKSAGGNSALAGGIFAVESHIQKKKNINITRREMFKHAMGFAHWKTNPDIIGAFIDKSADTVIWLENKGFSFGLNIENDSKFSTYHRIEGGGAALVRGLEKRALEIGVKIIRQAAVKKLLTDSSGQIAGAIAASNEGEFRINVRSVVVATGGYGGNRAMLKKYYAAYTDSMCLMGAPCMGDGIILALAIGADTKGLGTIHLHGPHFPGSHHIDALARQPQTLWVNQKGRRFCDETLTFTWPECSNILEQQPGNMCYSLLDSDIAETMREHGTIAMVLHVRSKTRLTDIEQQLGRHAEKGEVKISSDWGEIASWIGADPACLRHTVEKYNCAGQEHHDPGYYKDPQYLLPLKRPPFYAIRCYASFLGTLGGIRINHHMQVISKAGNPIPGLYAAGQDAGGWECRTYNLNMPGATFGFAVNSGRMAGENAFAYVSGD